MSSLQHDSAEAHRQAVERWEALNQSPGQAARWEWHALLRLVQSAEWRFPRIGHGILLSEDPVRLGQPPFLHPPPTGVAGLQRGLTNVGGAPVKAGDASKGERPPRIQGYAFGLFGPQGPLPLHLTELAYRRQRMGDDALAAFADVLHHRLVCYFFRAWADARKEVALDRPGEVPAGRTTASPETSWWQTYVGSLVGLGLDALWDRDSVEDNAKLYYSGRLMQPVRNAEGLAAILSDYFSVPVTVEEFVSRRVRIPECARWQLGGEGGDVGFLGLSTIAGDWTDDPQIGFRIRVGPVGRSEAEDFLPGTRGFEKLQDWVRFYVGRESDPESLGGGDSIWDLQLVLRGEEVPGFVLGQEVRLGWTTWLHQRPPAEAVEDLVVRPRGGPPAACGREENDAHPGQPPITGL